MIRCTTCLSETADGSLECLCCGLLLARQSMTITRAVANRVVEVPPHGHIFHQGKLPQQGVAIYVGAVKEPIIVPIKERVTLGRQKDLPVPDLVDLTPYDAYRLGVSRNHAALVFKNGQIYLHDIGSVNGSWLNGQRLKPYELYALPSGAMVSLGQLSLYVYY